MRGRLPIGSALIVVLAAALAGCSLEESPGERRPSSAPAPAAAPLGPEWSQDADGNVVPDFVERRIGRDPTKDDCLEKACPGMSAEGAIEPEREQNTLLILDSSGSMKGPAGGSKTKIQAAKDAIERFAVGAPDSFNVGLMVYGHRGRPSEAGKAESCAGSEVVAPLGELDYRSVDGVLRRFEPKGWTPVAGSLERARETFRGRQSGANRIVLVTDGLETCDGDPLREARSLKDAGLEVTVDVVGFDIARSQDAQALRRIAEVTGGEYTDARTGDALDEYFRQQQERRGEANKQILCAVNSGSRTSFCNANFGTDANREMTKLTSAANRAGRREEARAISALSRRSREQRSARNQQKTGVRRESIERLRREIDDANRRLRKRYGAQAALPSAAMACRAPTLASRLGLDAAFTPAEGALAASLPRSPPAS